MREFYWSGAQARRHGLGARVLALAVLAGAGAAPAQEALRNERAAMAPMPVARDLAMDSRPCTWKAGDFRLLVGTQAGLDWNDNVGVSGGGAGGSKSDFIFRPMLNLAASYPLTQRNLLNVSLGLGYDKYFRNSQLDRVRVTTGSGLSFDMAAGDFRFNFHDRVGYAQDSALEPAVANTTRYGNLDNSAGVQGVWDLADLTLSLGYDHRNVFSGASEFSSMDSASENLTARAGLKLRPELTAGVVASGSSTAYVERKLNNSKSYSVGGYAIWQPGKAVTIQPGAGYTYYLFDGGGPGLDTPGQGSWYCDLVASHQITEALSYSIRGGRELRSGVQSDLIDDWHVGPGLVWRLTETLSATLDCSYQHGAQKGAVLSGTVNETYDWFNAGLGLSCSITRRLSASVNYRWTTRSSSAADRAYDQNMAGILFNYTFQ